MKIHNNKKYEREFANLMCNSGYHCERIAGSGSSEKSVCDCILFMDKKCFLVEVKTTKENKFYVRKNIKDQLERMREVSIKNNINCLIAVKFKHKEWKTIDITENIPKVIEC